MIKNLLTISLVLSFLHCSEMRNNSQIKEGSYKGFAVAFFHGPISGSNYEIKIMPTSMDSLTIIRLLNYDIGSIAIDTGISYSDNYNNNDLSLVIKGSKKIELLNNPTLAPQFQSVYVCPIFIDFYNAENVTSSSAVTNKSIIEEDFIFKEDQRLTIKYFLASGLKINIIRPFSESSF